MANRGIIQKPRTQATQPFWETKTLQEMTSEEWESLCDGCGNCCLHKLRDDSTGELFQTNVACRLLDGHSGLCRAYAARQRMVADCTQLTAEAIPWFDWLPATCAYRLIAEGKSLQWWHPLVSGDPETVHQAGISVRSRHLISEIEIGDEPLENYIIDDEQWSESASSEQPGSDSNGSK